MGWPPCTSPHDPRHSRQVAVKVLRSELASALGPGRFLREIQIAANLSHPHIVPLYDSGEADGFLYYVMPFLQGETLASRVRREGGLPIAEAVQILREVTDALGFAHSRGVVHRDIKPDNVMLADRHAVVTDFGVAKAVTGAAADAGITSTGVAIGTPLYMAPEQATADPQVDHRADIYALGALAYELLTGRPPFTGPSPAAVLAAHVADEPEPVSTHRAELPAELAAVVMRCLAKAPGDRWQSADDVWTRLGQVTTPSGGTVPASASPTPKRHAIVVLPFTNQSPDPENEYVSDGFTEEIIADLSKVRALSVISRTSSMRLKGTTKDVRTIGRELGVRYVLEGSVRKARESLRITAQLIDALTDAPLWGDKYTGTLDDVFDLQERVSREIVKALNVTLTSDEDQRLAQRSIRDVRAYELYLQARLELRRHYGARIEQARKLLAQAMDIEGKTPPLQALQAWSLVTQVRSGTNRDLTPLEEAEGEARELLVQSPDAPYGHALLGYIVYERGQHPEAVRHFAAALEREPNDADALFYMGVSYIGGGQIEQAEETARRLLACDPLSSLSECLAGVCPWFIGRFEQGLPHLERGLEMDPQNGILRWCLGYTLACLGRVDDAAQQAEWMQGAAPELPYTLQLTALVEGMRGRKQRALEILAPIDLSVLDGHHKFHLAESFAVAGASDRALEILKQSVEQFYPYAYIAEHCPFFQGLRSLPRFAEIAARAKHKAEAF